MPIHSRLTFYCDGESLTGRIVLLTGVVRSGTTILGNILGSFQNVEYEFEPWIFHTVPPFVARKEMPEQAAHEIFRGFANESFTCHLLGRNANMRPTDDTRAWQRLSLDELFWRWTTVKDRHDVKRMALERKSIFCMKVTNLLAFYDLILGAYPHCKIIHILRNPLDVAKSVEKKKWVNLETLRTLEGLPIKKEVQIPGVSPDPIVPWWVKDEDVPEFLRASEFERGLYHWWRLILESYEKADKLDLRHSPQYKEVHYENLQADPRKTVQELADFMETDFTPRTEALIESVRPAPKRSSEDYPSIEGMNPLWQEKLLLAMERTGYASQVPFPLPVRK